jgi:hypothetical protein
MPDPAEVLTLKNMLSQTIPVQLFDEQGKLYQRNLTRKETFTVKRSAISPALQSQIDSGIIKVR